MTLFYRSWIECGITRIEHLSIVNGKVDETYLFTFIADKRRLLTQILELKTVLKPFIRSIENQLPMAPGGGNTNVALIEHRSKYYYNCLRRKKGVKDRILYG